MTTEEIIKRYNDAFQLHQPDLLQGLIAEDCVVDNVDGKRYSGPGEALAWWSGLAADPTVNFDLDEVAVWQDRAVIWWRLGTTQGVNLMRVRDGQIVEGSGYVKAG